MSDLNFCSNCGNKLAHGDLFCQSCGEKVFLEKKTEDISEPPIVQPPSPPSPPPIQQQYQPSQHQYQPNQQQYQPNQQQPIKKKSILPIILVILFALFVFVVVGGFFAYKYFMNKTSEIIQEVSTKVEKEVTKEPPTNTEQTTTQTEISKEPEQEKETVKDKTDLNDVSDVTGDSEPNTEHDAKNYPGKYPEGSKIYLDESDLVVYYGKDELKIMRNEIFARHGYIFQTDDMKSYFSKQSWYKPERTNVDNLMSKIEKKNVATIKSAEKQK